MARPSPHGIFAPPKAKSLISPPDFPPVDNKALSRRRFHQKITTNKTLTEARHSRIASKFAKFPVQAAVDQRAQIAKCMG
jgi:hypothetical protein